MSQHIRPRSRESQEIRGIQDGGLSEIIHSLRLSSNEYFDSRPLPPDLPRSEDTATFCINLDLRSQRQEIDPPLPEKALLQNDITAQDWYTFVNHLYPQNFRGGHFQDSVNVSGPGSEKRPRNNSSIARKPLPESASSANRTPSGQAREINDRITVTDAVIKHWNAAFFLPRSVQIIREESSTAPNTSEPGGGLDEHLAARVQQGVKAILDQRYVRQPSPSDMAPEAAHSIEPEAVFPTRSTSEDAPNPVAESGVPQVTPKQSRETIGSEKVTTADLSANIPTSNRSRGPLSKLSLRPKAKEDANFPTGTHPQEIALYKAISKGDKTMTKVLLQSGVSPDVSDISGASALYRSVCRGDSSIVKLLIDLSIDPNTRTVDGDTPLYRAVSRGDSSVVRYLLMIKTDVNMKNANGKTPLVKAVQRGDSSIVQMLLDRDADFSIDCNGMTALSLAASKGDSKIAKLMLKYHERVKQPPWAG